jgi:hypothetical protein
LRMCAHLAAALGAEPVESLRGTADPGWSLGLWRASALRRILWRTALKRRHL